MLNKEAPKSKLYNGRRYYFSWETMSKREANNMAKKLRWQGQKVRIVPYRGGYILYTRGLSTRFGGKR